MVAPIGTVAMSLKDVVQNNFAAHRTVAPSLAVDKDVEFSDAPTFHTVFGLETFNLLADLCEPSLEPMMLHNVLDVIVVQAAVSTPRWILVKTGCAYVEVHLWQLVLVPEPQTLF